MFSMKKDTSLFQQMNEWIAKGEDDKVKFIVEHTAPTDLADENGVTLLHSAAVEGNLHMMEYLISIGCEIDAKDSYNYTPFALAIYNSQWAAVKFLLKYNVDIFEEDFDGGSPLSNLMVSKEPDLEVLQIFFDKVKSISADNNEFIAILIEYECPLDKVIHLHDAEITKIFLLTADVTYDMIFDNSIYIAMRSMDEENMKLLLHHDRPFSYYMQVQIDSIFLKSLRKLFMENRHEESLADILSVTLKQIVEWKLLLESQGLFFESIFQEIPGVCLHRILDQSLILYTKNTFGRDIRTQLFSSAEPEALEMIKNGVVDTNSLGAYGETALHLATGGGAVETVKYLLDNGISPNVTNDERQTPIFEVRCAINRIDECLKLLLQYGADIQKTDCSGHVFIDYDYFGVTSDDKLMNIFVPHLAILQTSGVSLKESFHKTFLSSDERLGYFRLCCEKLENMKIKKVHSSLTLFEILTENLENLIARAKPLDYGAIDQFFRNSDLNLEEDYYAAEAKKRLNWAVSINNLRDKAVAAIFDNIEVLRPYYLVVKKICSFLNYYDLRVFE